MERECPRCKEVYIIQPGWGLDDCTKCFLKDAAIFIEEMKKEPAVERIIVYQGEKRVCVKGEDNV